MRQVSDASIRMAPVTALFAVKGQVHVNFLEVQSVSKADADHIAGAVDSACQRLDKQWKRKLVAIRTTGAAVMLGKNIGFVSKEKVGKQPNRSMNM